ncbi:hypothetical protein [Streptomyces sp. NPDC046870]|uniref:hypothetical protein n=1 Tax=Streptomyces sp. NPDC046870 TaxID=3155135 RepID=UPI003453E50D
MLDAERLTHPVIRDCVDALADGRGGLVVYEQGLGGRETLVAAAVRIAHATGKTLTIVDDELLREATADLAARLGLSEHTFLSPVQAASWPTGFDPDAVLAIHGDVLRNRDLVEPLRAAARDASVHGHLVVARHSYGSASLDTYTTQLRQITAAAFTPAPGAGDSIDQQTPEPIARRVQSESWQAQQIREPNWIPRETDLQAEARAQEPDSGGVFWVTQDESTQLSGVCRRVAVVVRQQFLVDEGQQQVQDENGPCLDRDDGVGGVFTSGGDQAGQKR